MWVTRTEPGTVRGATRRGARVKEVLVVVLLLLPLGEEEEDGADDDAEDGEERVVVDAERLAGALTTVDKRRGSEQRRHSATGSYGARQWHAVLIGRDSPRLACPHLTRRATGRTKAHRWTKQSDGGAVNA